MCWYSRSLWTQLVTAPPLPPPNWVRSRIRRLFLVSLGVPVDLDEILPSAKQKKLVLPSPHPSSDTNGTSGGHSGSQHAGGTPTRGDRTDASASSRSPQTSSQGRARGKGVPPPPTLDEAAARRLCSTTEAALVQLTNEELQQHVQQLEQLTQQAQDTLDYWLRRRDDGQGDKAAFEGVIENLVKHARRVRK